MSLLISTNMYRASDFQKVFEITDSFPGVNIGVEIFPMFHEDCYDGEMEKSFHKLEQMPVSFHGPYYQTEHSAPKGSAAYEESMKYLTQTLGWAEKMKCRYLVFHHNNCVVLPEQRKKMLENAFENLKEVIVRSFACGIPVAIENAGVKSRENMIFDQQEFIEVCRELKIPVLIDIGHAHANGWKLREVMEALKDQIISYHVHNNDGLQDAHRRIFDGTLDMEGFLRDFEKLTPEADFVLEYSMEVSKDVEGIKSDVQYLLTRLPSLVNSENRKE